MFVFRAMELQLIKESDMIQYYDFEVSVLPKVMLPTRTFIVTSGETAFIFSPGPRFPALDRLLKTKKEIVIVAPNMFHHMYLHEYSDLKAKYYGPLEILRKNTRFQSHIDTPEDFAEKYKSDFDVISLNGCPNIQESLYLVKKEKALIVTDLVFNFQVFTSKALKASLFLMGIKEELGTSRLVKLNIKNKKAFRESIQKVLKLKFNRVLVFHGSTVENPEQFRSHITTL